MSMNLIISNTFMIVSMLLLSTELFAQQHRPHKWPKGVILLNSGEALQGQIFYQPATVEANFTKPVTTSEPVDLTHFSENLKRLQIGAQEKIYFYRRGKTSAYNADQIIGFYYHETFKNPVRCFTTLPYRFEGGETQMYFFEVLNEGDISLLQHHAFVHGLGNVPTYFLALQDQHLVYCPPNRALTIRFLMKQDPRVSQFVRKSFLNFYEEKDFVRVFEYYNSLHPSHMLTDQLMHPTIIKPQQIAE